MPKVSELLETDPATAARDSVMARLAAARVLLASAVDSIDEAIGLFVEPDEDEDGAERGDLIDGALESVGLATRALEVADEIMPAVDPEECEPWDEDGDEVEPEPEPAPRKRRKSS